MLVLPDYNRPYAINSLTAPLVIRHHWMFNGNIFDFVLSEISYLEETTGPAIKISANGNGFWVPEAWHILVVDTDTSYVDTVPIISCASTPYSAFIFCSSDMKQRCQEIRVVDKADEMPIVHPMIPKGFAHVHPIGSTSVGSSSRIAPQLNIVIGPHDLYKILANKSTGDFLE